MPLKNFPIPSKLPTRRKDAGSHVRADGYVMEYCPEHPACTKRGYVMQHRLVMEVHLGRYLTGREVVHHLDENRQNNAPENLELASNHSAHLVEHHKLRRKDSNPEFAAALTKLATDPQCSVKQAAKTLCVSHQTIHACCKRLGLTWVHGIQYPTKARILRALQSNSRKDAVKLLGISLQTLWNQYPELMRMTANPKRLKQGATPDALG